MAKLITKDYLLTWTEQTAAGGADVAPDVDTAIPVQYAKDIIVFWDTTNASTNAPVFTFYLEISHDGTTYSNTHWLTVVSAVLENKTGSLIVTPPKGAQFMKGRLTVTVADLAAAEYVTLLVRFP